MIGIFGPQWVKGAAVVRKDTGAPGTIIGDTFGDYISVRWPDGSSSWIRTAMLRLVQFTVT